MNNNYSKAYKEVWEIIRHFPKDEYNKIPNEKIEFYLNNMDADYQFEINPKMDLASQNISIEANSIIVNLYKEYFATDKQNQKIDEILLLNQQEKEKAKIKKYNSIFDNKFENISIDNKNSENLPIEIKNENFFIRFINYIKRILKKF